MSSGIGVVSAHSSVCPGWGLRAGGLWSARPPERMGHRLEQEGKAHPAGRTVAALMVAMASQPHVCKRAGLSPRQSCQHQTTGGSLEVPPPCRRHTQSTVLAGRGQLVDRRVQSVAKGETGRLHAPLGPRAGRQGQGGGRRDAGPAHSGLGPLCGSLWPRAR